MPSLHLLAHASIAIAVVLFAGSPARAQDRAPPIEDAPPRDIALLVTAPPPAVAAPSPLEASAMRRGTGGRRLLDRRVRLLVGALGGVRERYARTSFGYAAALMILGGTLIVVPTAEYLLLAAFSTPGSLDEARPLTGASVAVGLGFFVIGLTTLLIRASRRRGLERRMQELEHELDAYGVLTALDLRTVPSGAVVNGTVRF